MKKLSLELGGNAPFIVFDDADLDAAVQGAIASKYRNTGQTCVCANRLSIQAGVYEKFAAKLKLAVAGLRVGDGLAGVTDQGPLIDAKAVAKVEEHIADALSKGAKVMLGGKRHALGGSFFEPTILTEVTPKMLVAREETSDRWRRYSSLRPRLKRSAWRMTRSSAWPPTYTRRILRVVGGFRRRSNTEYRIEHRHHLHRSRAIRRRQGIRHRARGFQVRHSRLHRDQIRMRRRSRSIEPRWDGSSSFRSQPRIYGLPWISTPGSDLRKMRSARHGRILMPW